MMLNGVELSLQNIVGTWEDVARAMRWYFLMALALTDLMLSCARRMNPPFGIEEAEV